MQVSRGVAVLWFTDSGNQWSLRKESAGLFGGTKLWYIAKADDAEDPLPPKNGWAVSAKASKRWIGEAAFSIEPAPTMALVAAAS